MAFDKNQLDLISKQILTKCNFYKTKSAFNKTFLRNGEGKSAITSGLTLNEFAKKFKLPK